MLKYIIILACIAFLLVLFVIYFKEIKEYIKSKLFKKNNKKNKSKGDTQAKPKEEKKVVPTVEDFKPIARPIDESRDSSIEQLFSMDEALDFMDDDTADFEKKLNEEIDKLFDSSAEQNNEQATLSDNDKRKFDDFFGSKKPMYKMKNGNKYMVVEENETIAEQIKNLSPELKALLLDNVLKRRDDV